MVKDKFKFKYQTSLLEIYDLFFDSRNKQLLINPTNWEVIIIELIFVEQAYCLSPGSPEIFVSGYLSF